ncbi:aldo/keto reductase [Anthocerotibacter panamensis]|uniref:aldo/keto reductase n=1 Tax=Anthocerotibacter panamensis TaxID=2857077 RepID=UPI001C407FD4|nr:aldo/keto reductase [Anthocerotibacter panamensis]
MPTTTAVALGPNGPKVPPLGLGTWAWGDKLFWDYGSDYGEKQVAEAFEASLEAGVTFFDTAEIYGLGESERLLARFMRKGFMRKASTPIQIATKYSPAPWRFSEQAVSEALSDSLKRLNQESVALYQVHWPFNFLMNQETLFSALAREYQRGRIQAVGVSNYSAQDMTTAYKLLAQAGVPLAVNQVRYSLLDRGIEQNGILDTARRLGVTILAYSPLAQGLLTGKYTPAQPPTLTGARRLDPQFSAAGLQKIAPLLKRLQEVGASCGRTPAQVALNWLIAQGVVPIPGAKTAGQALQNGGALGWSLTDSEVAELDGLSRRV